MKLNKKFYISPFTLLNILKIIRLKIQHIKINLTFFLTNKKDFFILILIISF